MYGIPKDFDLSPLIGHIIERIDLGPHIMHIRFGNGWTVSCEGSVTYQNATNVATIRDREWQDINSIKPLLGSAVSSWQKESEKMFSISLKDKGRIMFADDSNEFESFQIEPRGWII